MVEGPEATYLATYLKKHFAKRRLSRIQIKDGRYKHHGPPANYQAFVGALPLRLLDVGNKGKVVFLLFEGGWVVIAKLGMTGWFYRPTDRPWFEPRPNIVFDFAGGIGSGSGAAKTQELFYSDFRNFGTLTFTQNMMTVLNEYTSIADNILSEAATWRHLQPRIKALQTNNPRMTIDTLLMDQGALVSGIGNIIKSELLYDARISPRRTLASLRPTEWQTILTAARKFAKKTLAVLENAGSDGRADYSEYVSIRQVYNKTHDKLNNKVAQFMSADGRKTYWVPAVQV
jgi:formamidopyrimidine-DNA glycosylase